MFLNHCTMKSRRFLILTSALTFVGAVADRAFCANAFDAGASSQWWFAPTNWSADLLPPNNATNAVTDTQINNGINFAGDLGEGVVYDPSANDPGFAAAGSATFPAGFGPQILQQLYITRNTPNTNLLTIKGDLTMTGQVIVGRSSGTRGLIANARINQLGGVVTATLSSLDLGQTDTSNNGRGAGIYDYRAGTLNVSRDGGSGLRISNGTTSVVGGTSGGDGLVAGPSGAGRLIVHNPSSGGFVRAFDVVFAAYAGQDDANFVATDPLEFDARVDPDGITTGVASAEFHYENGKVRPVQVARNLTINNGKDQNTGGARSARLELKLDSAPTVLANIPQNLGLFDVDFDTVSATVGAITGSGDLNNDMIYNNDRIFSNADATVNYREGDVVSAIFGATKYNWTISYSGNITWTDSANSVVNQITGATTGLDVVLIGQSIENLVVNNSDFNSDLTVDGADLLLWQKGLGGANGTAKINGNANADALVDGVDLGVWTAHFGGPPAVAAIGAAPEPATAVLFGVAALIFAARRRTH